MLEDERPGHHPVWGGSPVCLGEGGGLPCIRSTSTVYVVYERPFLKNTKRQRWKIGLDVTQRFVSEKHILVSPAITGTSNDEHVLDGYRVEQQPSVRTNFSFSINIKSSPPTPLFLIFEVVTLSRRYRIENFVEHINVTVFSFIGCTLSECLSFELNTKEQCRLSFRRHVRRKFHRRFRTIFKEIAGKTFDYFWKEAGLLFFLSGTEEKRVRQSFWSDTYRARRVLLLENDVSTQSFYVRQRRRIFPEFRRRGGRGKGPGRG